MHRREPAQDSVILHHDVPGQRCIARHDDAVAQHAVMRDVDIGQQQVIGADDGGLAVVRGAVNVDAFAEHIAVADLQPRDATFPF